MCVTNKLVIFSQMKYSLSQEMTKYHQEWLIKTIKIFTTIFLVGRLYFKNEATLQLTIFNIK